MIKIEFGTDSMRCITIDFNPRRMAKELLPEVILPCSSEDQSMRMFCWLGLMVETFKYRMSYVEYRRTDGLEWSLGKRIAPPYSAYEIDGKRFELVPHMDGEDRT